MLVVGSLGALGAGGCSLSNIVVDDCSADGACEAAFGLGSVCAEGYCSAPTPCSSGYECRELFGGGACVLGACRASLPAPVDASATADCPLDWREPADLGSLPLTGLDAPVIVGGIFSTGDPFDQAQSAAARLAVREINRTGGLTDGRKLGLVICDNGGPGNSADGAEREGLNQSALDYLAGTLGVPAIVGPFSSSDSLTLINHALSRRYPVAIVSPAATSPQLSDQPDRFDASDPYGLLWRTCSSDELQGEVLASYIPATDVVGVVYIQDAYGEGLRDVFMSARTADVELYPFDSATDLGVLAQSVAADNPTSVLVIAVVAADTVAVLTEMAAAGLGSKQFYFTDGSKDGEQLLDPSLPQGVLDIVANAIGTAPAAPSGQAFSRFNVELEDAFGIGANDTAFLANTYDATYVIGFGIVHAGATGSVYDGRDLTAGFASLSAGQSVDVGATTWVTAKGGLSSGARTIDIEGTSGHLDFDARTGEAPGPVEIWSVEPGLTGFHTEQVIYP